MNGKMTEAQKRAIQVAVAYEALIMDETGKTKAQIAKEYGISPSSIKRYAEKYETEAMDMLAKQEKKRETEEKIAAKAAAAPKSKPEKEEPKPAPKAKLTTVEKTKVEHNRRATDKKSGEDAIDADLQNVENRGSLEPLVESTRGRSATKSLDMREFYIEFDHYSESDQQYIRRILRKLMFKVGGKHRLTKPLPDSVIAYRDSKGKYEEFQKKLSALGNEEKTIQNEFKRAKPYFIDEKL